MYLFLFVSAALFTTEIQAQKFSGLDKSPHDISYYKTSRGAPPLVKVVYGRPQLKGRKIGSELAPYGKIWRTGANEATEVTFYKDVQVGDKAVKAGTYVLHTIPGEKEWTVILNSNLNVWGAYQYDKNADVARIKVPAETAAETLEAFSIAFKGTNSGADMVLGWGTTRINIPVNL